MAVGYSPQMLKYTNLKETSLGYYLSSVRLCFHELVIVKCKCTAGREHSLVSRVFIHRGSARERAGVSQRRESRASSVLRKEFVEGVVLTRSRSVEKFLDFV